MLVIKAEIWPQGDIDTRFEIARVAIINRSSQQQTASIADYNVIGILGRDHEEYIRESAVTGFPRYRGWQALASLALPVTGPRLFHPEYTETVVDLLKRG